VSKAFTREDDLADGIVPTPRRASGDIRYVTPEGMRSLTEELASLDPSSRRAQVLAATLPLLVVQAPRCEGTVAFGADADRPPCRQPVAPSARARAPG